MGPPNPMWQSVVVGGGVQNSGPQGSLNILRDGKGKALVKMLGSDLRPQKG